MIIQGATVSSKANTFFLFTILTVVLVFISEISFSEVMVSTDIQDPNPASIHSTRGAWPLYRQWNKAEIAHFAQWIENIYDVKSTGTKTQRLAKIEEVLTDPEINLLMDSAFIGEPSNPQLSQETMQVMHRILDCGKLTISLTGYYAYRRGLPFMISWIRSGDGGDIRTSAFNNVTGGTSSFDYESTHRFFVDAVHGFNTGHYRIEPHRPGAALSDTVPVAITRDTLLPGSLFYLDGHVLILGKVDNFGELYFLDSTTAPTRGIYYHNSMNAVTGITAKYENPDEPLAGCYRGFRIHRYPIAEVDDSGRVLRVRRRTDDEMKEFGYSLEQYEKLAMIRSRQKINENGITLDNIHDFIRLRMRSVDKINPIKVLESFADELLAMCNERELMVQAGWQDVLASGPVTFPEKNIHYNVFNARGRWGDTTTAPMDVDLRARYFQSINFIDMAIAWFGIDSNCIIPSPQWDNAVFSQGDLAFQLIRAKNELFSSRKFFYINSQGVEVPLTLMDVEKRLFDLSFDPNHAPELRWGAPLDSDELASAREIATPLPSGAGVPMLESFKRQAYYRTLTHREQDQSFLAEMFTEGFPIQQKLTPYITARYRPMLPPPLVPWYFTPVG